LTVTAIDPEQIAEFALRLVRIPSLSGEEALAAREVAAEMTRLGYQVEVDAWGNVIGTIGAESGPCVLIDAHLDTVGVTDPAAWSHDPAGERADRRLYGRGTMDMKGPLAAVVHGVATVRKRLSRGRVVVSATLAEEMIEGPMTAAVARRVRPDYVVIAEATSLRLARGQRGRAEMVIETHGRPTHSSRPELGVNAAQAMIDVILALRGQSLAHHPVLGDGILVLTDILSRPYPALSVVPDSCLATFDRRTLPGETMEDVLAPIRVAVDKSLAAAEAHADVRIAEDHFATYTGLEVNAANFAPAWFYGEDATIVRQARAGLLDAGLAAELTHYAFCTNGSATAGELNIPTIGFGPGDETLAHRVDEYVEIDDLASAARGYAGVVLRLLEDGV